ETVAEQGLRAHLRPRRLPHHAGLQVDDAVAQRRAVLVGLLHEAQPHAGSFFRDAGNEARSKILHETFAGPQRERAGKRSEVELLGRTQRRFSVQHELADLFAQRERPAGRHQTASGPDQQRIARGLAQARQRPAHGRGAQPQPSGRARDAAFLEQHIEGDQQVEIGRRHCAPAFSATMMWRQTHEYSANRASSAISGDQLPLRQRRSGVAADREAVGKPMIGARDDAIAAGAIPTASARWALAGLSLSMLLSALGTSIANVALPTLAQAFAASFQDVQWVVLAYLLAITSLIVGAGRLGDLTGRRRLLLAGLVLFTAASVF